MSSILSVIAIAISLISGGFALYTFRWTANRDRKLATLEAYNRLQRQALDHLNQYTHEQIAEISTDYHSQEYKQISTYIARVEHFCVGVCQRIYDVQTVYELAHGYFDGSLKKRIEPIIRKKNFSEHDYYQNIHNVYAWMEQETARRERKSQ